MIPVKLNDSILLFSVQQTETAAQNIQVVYLNVNG